MEFIALDVETANSDLASICSVGLVHFKDGTPLKTTSFLIDPEDEFDGMNIAIHGITPDDVVGKPTMREILPLISNALHQRVIAHHTPFDRVAFKRAAAKYSLPQPELTWLDTAAVARRAWERFADRGYGLENLAREFGIEFSHHVAAEDARAAGLILVRAMQENGLSLDECITRARQPLREKAKVLATSGNPNGPLAGEVIVFTGALALPRTEAARLAVEMGCDVRNSVTSGTTILVIGNQDVRRIKGQDKSSKHRKAEEIIRGGAQLRIISEADFQRLISEF
ncbi:DNA polymerase III subunit epsilon [freshwater sediment metagenome]|uniref:DNA polymerase III subunit epsilon n=1 Tax=freshwater sediment metagenome TaxID=556182 RepID=A0AA48M2D3_9ZZZZ